MPPLPTDEARAERYLQARANLLWFQVMESISLRDAEAAKARQAAFDRFNHKVREKLEEYRAHMAAHPELSHLVTHRPPGEQ